jgi:hypothetical protein
LQDGAAQPAPASGQRPVPEGADDDGDGDGDGDDELDGFERPDDEVPRCVPVPCVMSPLPMLPFDDAPEPLEPTPPCLLLHLSYSLWLSTPSEFVSAAEKPNPSPFCAAASSSLMRPSRLASTEANPPSAVEGMVPEFGPLVAGALGARGVAGLPGIVAGLCATAAALPMMPARTPAPIKFLLIEWFIRVLRS